MLEMYRPLLLSADAFARKGNRDQALRAIRALPLSVLGDLLLDVPEDLPGLKTMLPRMAEEHVQVNWTGSSGRVLLGQTVAFVRSLTAGYAEHGDGSLEGQNVLDFGCGWGRVLRLMLKYTEPRKLFGVDPWDEAIRICRQDGVLGELALCDYLPDALPFGKVHFDLVYAFSVFTHLSERTAQRCLSAIGRRLAPKGLLVITIRPIEYWAFHGGLDKGYTAEALAATHRRDGYAFFPHNRTPIEGEITYGDASMSLDHIREAWREWQIVGTDYNEVDSLQVVVFLKRREARLSAASSL